MRLGLKLMPVALPNATGFGAATPSESITLMLSAMLALNGTTAAPRVNSRPVPALKVSVARPDPRSAMAGSVAVDGKPEESSVGLAGVGAENRPFRGTM